MQKRRPAFLLAILLAAPCFLFAQPKIQLQSYATGFSSPLDIAHCGDSRLFIVEQRGMIWMLDSLGNRLQDTFLNITDRVLSGGERGLLGLAFPPGYAQSGEFYVNYTFKPDGNSRISRFKLKAGNPNQADPDSEEILLTQSQPYSNHNGGCLKFGPDGYLYCSFGDGGSGGDPQGNAQNRKTFLGKILRIDVHSVSPGLPYGIPADNPFVNDSTYFPQIWSLGLRNPWRFSFDRLTGDMWIGDVGQSTREEVDFEPANTGGRNYGWRCYEGSVTYSAGGCLPASNYTGPVFDYDNNSIGCSVTGGFIYRGAKFSDLYGVYLFTDYCSGRWWTIRRNPAGDFVAVQIADLANSQYSCLGEDRDGQLYVAAIGQGTIYKINELCSSFQISGVATDASCNGAFDGKVDLQISGGLAPLTIAWTGGQTDTAALNLDPGTYAVQVQDGNGCIRRDTFEVGAQVQVSAPEATVKSWSVPFPIPGFLCNGDTVVLEASEAPAGFGYQWYRGGLPVNGATDRELIAIQAGQYDVEFTGTPCNSPHSEKITIQEIHVAVTDPDVWVLGPTFLCPGDTTTLQSVTLPYSLHFQWYRNGDPIPGATDSVLTVTQGGSYTVKHLTSACAFYTSNPVQIGEEPLITDVKLLFVGDTLRVSTGPWASYQWYWYGVPIAGATESVYVPEQNGFYECVLLTSGGCQYQAGLYVIVVGTRLPVSVQAFTLAPNPTASDIQLTLTLARPEQVTFVLQDVQNRAVYSTTLYGQRIEHKIDLLNVPAGTYYLNVKLESGNFVRAVVKN